MKFLLLIEATLKSRVFQLTISIILLIVLMSMMELGRFTEIVVNSNPYYLLAAATLMTANRLLMPVKWNILLRSHQLILGWRQAISIYYVATFFGLFLPTTIGADSLRAIYTKKAGLRLQQALASIVVERLLGALTILAIGIMGIVTLLTVFTGNTESPYDANLSKILTTISAILLLLIICFSITLSDWFAKLALRTKEFKQANLIIDKLYTLYSAYSDYRDQKAVMFLFVALTMLEVSMPIIWSWLVALAIGLDQINPLHFFAFVPLTLLISRLPISIDGFGVNEAAYVYFLSLAGVASEEGFAIGFITHILYLICLTPGLILFATKDKVYRNNHGDISV